MATSAGAGAVRQLQIARGATKVSKSNQKAYGKGFEGAFAVDPDRSNGVPLNPQFRNPPPGANPPEAYDDPVTVPSADIAGNAYYQRDVRRSYPRLSVVNQADVVGLLSVGSKAGPREDQLLIGDAGKQQLIALKETGESKGLSAYFEKEKSASGSLFGPDGLPPFPTGLNRTSPAGAKEYVMDQDRAEGFPKEYPCRTFV